MRRASALNDGSAREADREEVEVEVRTEVPTVPKARVK